MKRTARQMDSRVSVVCVRARSVLGLCQQEGEVSKGLAEVSGSF
jgi:hypothetical protein